MVWGIVLHPVIHPVLARRNVPRLAAPAEAAGSSHLSHNHQNASAGIRKGEGLDWL